MFKIINLFIVFLFSLPALAIQTITIEHGRMAPTPIAINHFAADNAGDKKLAEEMIKVIENDLKNSGLFRPISSSAFIEHKTGIKHKPLFAAWRQINASALVNGEVKKLPSGKVEVSFVLWDPVLEKDMVGEVFAAPSNLSRRLAHKIADKIYERITGDKGYFDTKVAYISETRTGRKHEKIKRLAIMDQDGANHQYLTDGRYLVLTPRFSPKGDKIMYLSYVDRKPRVHLRNLATGKDSIVGHFPGMTLAPRFSPDGNKALISLAKGGATNIYEINLKTMHTTRLTNGYAISTSPSYSPDGSKIVFNSDRSGSRQLYVMDVDGSNVERISFGGGSYAAPVWSPRGDYIAFTKITRGEGFTIGVMRSDGSGERIIASGYLTEGPTWAPNGRVIMFTKEEPPFGKQGSKSKIYSIDLTGYNEQLIVTPKDASDPEWSNLRD